MEDTNERAVAGNNRTPFELAKESLEDLYAEAKQWLDGSPVTTQEEAAALNTLQTRIRETAKEAEKQRKAEAKQFDDGKAEVQARYKPILALADTADAAVKSALEPYLKALERKQQEEARIAREEANRKTQEALEAMRNRDAANIESREAAEKLLEDAKKAERDASKAEDAKAHAKGEGRATGLRTVWVATMIDQSAAAKWVWNERRPELMTWIQDQADKAVRAGARKIEGFNIEAEKRL